MQQSEHVTPPSIKGLSVLVCEDEGLICILLEDMLEDAGCSIVGPYSSTSETMEAIETVEFDVALVDLGLADGPSDPVLEELAARSKFFAIMSGNSAIGDFDAAARLPKPFTFDDVVDTLRLLAQRQSDLSQG
ncbi:response regulator [Croceicoccus mobilis]|uniref:Response regulator n=1 Tax=Croceicoccus mobilis TaxID=1703339 RepID=A0A916Z386_9SPHN|nr:response regulator [Croceicoccus mobilis]